MKTSQILLTLATQHRSKLLLAWLALVAVLASGLLGIEITPDNRIFYSDSNSRFQELVEFEGSYLPNNNILLVVHSADVDASEMATAVRWLDDKAWHIQNTLRVESLASFPVVVEATNESVELAPLLDAVCRKPASCLPTQHWVKNHPEIVGRLADETASTLAVVLTIDIDIGTTEQIGAISSDVNRLKSEFKETFSNIDIVHTGGVAMMQAFADAANEDTAKLLPLALAGILTVCWVTLGSLYMTALLIALGTTAALATMGLAGHLGLTINTATSITGLVVFTVVVASSMHIIVSYMNDCTLYDQLTASENALIVNLKPVAIATLTSVAGFLSMLLADAPPLNQLGALSAFGILFGGIQSITVAPAILPKISPAASSTERLAACADWLGKDRHPRLMLFPLCIILAVGITGVSRLSINDDFVAYFDEGYNFRAETDKIESLLSSPNHIELEVDSGTPEGIYDPNYIAYLRSLDRFLASEALVASAFGYTDILKKIGRFAGKDVSESGPSELAQLFLVYELSLSAGQSTNDFVTPNKQKSRVSILLKRSNSKQINRLKSGIESWASEQNASIDVIVTGENIPVANLTALNATSMAYGIAFSIAIASLLIALAYKNILLGAIGFAAIVLPIVVAFGIWGWIYGEIGLAAVIVVSITIGIVIDDAIHLISRYRSFSAQPGKTNSESVAQAVRVVGAAIIVTSAALMVGFSAMSTSGFGINAALGICTVLVIGLSLAIDLILVPAAIRRLPERLPPAP